MKMAKATQRDIDGLHALNFLANLLFESREFPGGDDEQTPEEFDIELPTDCQRAMHLILTAFDNLHLFRIIGNLTVLLDPDNRVVDPTKDYLDHHPDLAAAQKDQARYLWLRDKANGVNFSAPLVFFANNKGDVVRQSGGQSLDDELDAAMKVEL